MRGEQWEQLPGLGVAVGRGWARGSRHQCGGGHGAGAAGRMADQLRLPPALLLCDTGSAALPLSYSFIHSTNVRVSR